MQKSTRQLWHGVQRARLEFKLRTLLSGAEPLDANNELKLDRNRQARWGGYMTMCPKLNVAGRCPFMVYWSGKLARVLRAQFEEEA